MNPILTKQDKNSDKRFFIALILSILIHIVLAFFIYTFNKLITPKQHLEKLDASNLLILKRGASEDKSKNKPGTRPSLASRFSPPAPPPSIAQMPSKQSFSSMTPQKKQQDQKQTQQETKEKSQKKDIKSLEKSSSKYIDPKKLSFLSPAQALAFQNPYAPQPSQLTKENDKGQDEETQREISELYGDEFGDLGSAEKDFIKNNLKDIGRITQKYLTYPREAGILGQSGVNAVEFYLYPNGDISDLRIMNNKSSGFVLLDKNSIKTIEIAYKDYPRPTTKTLIRIYVTYCLTQFCQISR